MMKKILKALGFIVVCYGMPLVIDLGVQSLVKNLEPIKTWSQSTYSIFFGIFDPFSVLALFLFMTLVKKKSLLQSYGGFRKISLSNFAICAVLGIFMAAFTQALISLDYIKAHYGILVGTIGFLVGGNIFLLLWIITVNSFYKEFDFRGLIFNELRTVFPVTIALIIQAAIYGSQLLIFQNWIPALYAFIGAYLFGIIYYNVKSLWGSFISQFCCTLTLIFFNKTVASKLFNNQSGLYLLGLSVILIVIVSLVMYQTNKNLASKAQKASV